MSKKLKFLAMVLTCIVLSVNDVFAETHTWTMASGDLGSTSTSSETSGTKTVSGVTWSYNRK